jgi:hypothetical protein
MEFDMEQYYYEKIVKRGKKYCRDCSTWLTLEHFTSRIASKDGFSIRCTNCQRKRKSKFDNKKRIRKHLEINKESDQITFNFGGS